LADEDVVALHQVMGDLLQSAADLVRAAASGPRPATPPLPEKQPGTRPPQAPEDWQFEAYRLYQPDKPKGKPPTQKAVAKKLTEKFGGRFEQYDVSRGVRKVKSYLQKGGTLPECGRERRA